MTTAYLIAIRRTGAQLVLAEYGTVGVTAFEPGELRLPNLFTGAETRLACKSLLIVGARFANDSLYQSLVARPDALAAAGIASVTRIGDALAPGALVHAVYSGHRYARELDANPSTLSFRRDAPLRSQAITAPEGINA